LEEIWQKRNQKEKQEDPKREEDNIKQKMGYKE